jgi:2'-5' RNA ligase
MEPEAQPFRAHLTLARPRQGARVRLPESLSSLSLPGIWRAGAPALFQSLPGERPRYRRLG